MDIILIIGIVLFVISLAAAAYVFIGQRLATQRLADKQQALQEAQAAFEPELIEELKRLDRKIELAGDLLADHKKITTLFDILHKNTLQSVQYTEFAFATVSEDAVQISMSGSVDDYASLALQADVLGSVDGITNLIFSDFSLDEIGNVQFSITFNVTPELLQSNEYTS